jgi:hypothetical protein
LEQKKMRKTAMLVLAVSTLAVAAPALAQPPGHSGQPGYDRRGPDRNDDRRGGDFQRDLAQLNDRVERDFQRGIISKKVAKAFFSRIKELQKAEGTARGKNGGRLSPGQRRDMDVAIDRVRDDLRLNEERGGRGYR